MAHFAQVDETGTVQMIVVVSDADQDRAQHLLVEELQLPGRWVQTSYNTRGGVHFDSVTGLPSDNQTRALRKNFACVGGTYDEKRDAFLPPKPFLSWVLDEETCLWKAPVSPPEEGGPWSWNEETTSWAPST